MAAEWMGWVLLGMMICAAGGAGVAAGIAAKTAGELRELRRSCAAEWEREEKLIRSQRQELQGQLLHAFQSLGQAVVSGQSQAGQREHLRAQELRTTLEERLGALERRQESLREAIEMRLQANEQTNARQLDAIRQTVDEKLQKTLESRISQSFRLVSERLEQVYKGLGEMQGLAAGVGDLKKVLSNVKTRGVLGELQLEALLTQILSPEQLRKNVVPKPGSRCPVEFAVVLPGDGETPVLLPVDAKFPADPYHRLCDAYELGDRDQIAACSSELSSRLKGFAKDIHDKYLDPPNTTDFALLYLPFEGLYAQALQLGLLEVLLREYQVCLAGPTTMAALLSSLQMGFRSLAIQRRSGDAWRVLGAVKTEFARFGEVLDAAQRRIGQTSDELDRLVGVRTRMILKSLSQVSELSPGDADALLLPIDEGGNAGPDDRDRRSSGTERRDEAVCLAATGSEDDSSSVTE